MTKKQEILIVDDEKAILSALERDLSKKFQITTAQSAMQALGFLREKNFAVVISDQKMTEMTGIEFLAHVFSITPNTTRILLTAYTDLKEILDAINLAHIDWYVTKPWNSEELLAVLEKAVVFHELQIKNQDLLQELAQKNAILIEKEEKLSQLNQRLEEEVKQRTKELRKANEKLGELAMTDSLTRIMNRRAIFQKLQEEMERASRYERSFVMGMIDVDHFKSFNDMEGHVLGDEALKKIAQILSGNIRKTDSVGRYGGEEFLLLMPETQVSAALEICERLRGIIEKTEVQGNREPGYLTISVGLTYFRNQGETGKELIQIADQALYEAKQRGRNRIVVKEKIDNASFFL